MVEGLGYVPGACWRFLRRISSFPAAFGAAEMGSRTPSRDGRMSLCRMSLCRSFTSQPAAPTGTTSTICVAFYPAGQRGHKKTSTSSQTGTHNPARTSTSSTCCHRSGDGQRQISESLQTEAFKKHPSNWFSQIIGCFNTSGRVLLREFWFGPSCLFLGQVNNLTKHKSRVDKEVSGICV